MTRFVLLATLVAACGGGGGDDGDRPDGRRVDAPAEVCGSGVFLFSQTAQRDDELFFYTGLDDSRPDRLTVDFYFGLGAIDGPNTVTFTGEDLAACATCVFIHRGETSLMAQSGTLEVTALGPIGTTFGAVLRDVVFAEVTIQDLNSTLVPGGDTECVEEQTLSAGIDGA